MTSSADGREAPERRPGPVTRVRAVRISGDGARTGEEQLATEEPLEVRVGSLRLAVTMRTPGADFELAVGWLHGEGVVDRRADVLAVRYCTDVDLQPDERFNVVTVDLAGPALARVATLPGRAATVSSACGVCGRETIADLRGRCHALPPAQPGTLSAALLAGLPELLRAGQRVFDRTGGLHAAGLFVGAEPLVVREDVGRHNAVDKAVGWALLQDRLPLTGSVLVVSGRTSFEIVQKALVAGLTAVVAVSAPSSLAVQLAREAGLTLAGFARDGRVTVYSGEERVSPT